MKKIIVFFAVLSELILLFTVNTFAQTNADIVNLVTDEIAVKLEFAEDAVNVSGNVKETADKDSLTVVVFNPNKSVADWGDNSALQYQFEHSIKPDKTFSFSFVINDLYQGIGGRYTMLIKNAAMEKAVPVSFFFGDAAAKSNAIKNINDCVIATSAEVTNGEIVNLQNEINSLSSGLLCDYAPLKAVDSFALANRLALKIKSEPFNQADYESSIILIKQEILLETIKEGKKAALTDANGYLLYGELTGIDKMDAENSVSVNEVYTTRLNKEGIDNVAKALLLKDLKTISDLQKEFAKAVVIEGIRNDIADGYGHINSLLNKNAAYVGLDLKNYNNPTALKDAKLLDKGYDSLSEVQEVLNEDLEEEEEDKGSSGGGRGNSSSSVSVGGLGGLNSGTTVTPEIEKQPQKEEKFSDMYSAEWAKEAVYALAEKGVISYPEDGKFRPNDNVTREEFVKMLILAFELESDEAYEAVFEDIADDRWSKEYIYTAYNKGIVSGIEENKFGPELLLLRQDMAVLIHRTLIHKGVSLTDKADEIVFSDDEQISEYAKESVYTLCKSGCINGMGDGTFAPQAFCTRAQAAKLLYLVLKI